MGVLAVAAVAAILWGRGDPPVAGPERFAAADGDRAADATSALAAAAEREPVAPEAAAGRIVLRGTVRLAGSGATVSGGFLNAIYGDGASGGIAADSLAGRDDDELSQHRIERRAALTATGDYEIELAGSIFLVGMEIEPPDEIEVGVGASRESIRFGGFERREVRIGEAITAPIWQRDFEVGPGGRLAGFVVETGSGAPVPAALVRVASGHLFDLQGAHSDARGAFSVTGLLAESVFGLRVRVSCQGFQDRELMVRPVGHGPTQVLVELEREVAVGGRVLDPEGRGVAGARVDAAALAGEPAPFGHPLAFVQSTQTDGDGSFRFSLASTEGVALRAEGSYRVSAEPERWAHGVSRLSGIASLRDPRDLRLELRPQASFRVRATYPGGSEVPGHDLVVLVEEEEGWRRFGARFTAPAAVEHVIRVLAPPPAAAAGGRPLDERTAFRGSATCAAARADGERVDVAVALEPWQPEMPPPLTHEADGGIVFRQSSNAPEPHASFVRDLTFLDADTGEPLANRLCSFKASDGSGWARPLSSQGRFRLALGPGTIDLVVAVDGYQSQAFRVANPASGFAAIEVRLRPAP